MNKDPVMHYRVILKINAETKPNKEKAVTNCPDWNAISIPSRCYRIPPRYLSLALPILHTAL